MILFALVSLALADTPVDADLAPPVEPSGVVSPDLVEPVAGAVPPSSSELLTDARVRLLRGDYEGVRILTTNILDRPDADHRAARYLTAMSFEYEGELEVALQQYEALLAERPDVDVQFRRAETLGRLGRHDEAIAALDALGDDWEGGNRVQIEVLRAIFALDSGKSARKPLKALRSTLEAAGPDDAPWYQAMARFTLIDLAVTEADGIAFTGGKRKKTKRLEHRAGLVAIASEQTLAVIQLDAPEFTLQSLAALARAHEGFGQAMLDESPVKRLTDDQRALYERERAARVETLWIKAARYYERAITYAGEIGWRGEPLPTLLGAREAVLRRVEQLPVD